MSAGIGSGGRGDMSDKTKGTKMTLANQIEAAQERMHDQMLAALRQFTTETGMRVQSVTWRAEIALDEKAHTAYVDYYEIESELATSLSRGPS
jgi:hypothetical protein